MAITFQSIQQYLLHYEVEGNKVYCEFETPDGEMIESYGPIKKQRNMKSQVTQKLGKMAGRQASRHASRMIRGVLGGGMLGRLGSQVTRSTVRDAASNSISGGEETYTEAEQQEAVVKAFIRVARKFGMSRSGEMMASKKKIKMRERGAGRRQEIEPDLEDDSLSPYQLQLERYPIRNNFEKELMARFLVELAKADGRINSKEKELLNSVIPSNVGSIQDLLTRDSISKIECEEIPTGVKESMYMIGWTVALIDFDLDPDESTMLYEYGDLFGIDPYRRKELSTIAKKYVLESAIDVTIGRSELHDLADQLHLDREDAERYLIQMKKRM